MHSVLFVVAVSVDAMMQKAVFVATVVDCDNKYAWIAVKFCGSDSRIQDAAEAPAPAERFIMDLVSVEEEYDEVLSLI